MALKRVILYDIEQLMLIVEHSSGVIYQNQVGGVICYQEEIEGILVPLDVNPENTERIERCRYPDGLRVITIEIADLIDALLASRSSTSYIKVNRERLTDSWEAWVHVLIDSPANEIDDEAPSTPRSYYGLIYGFGSTRGVLTWPNSD